MFRNESPSVTIFTSLVPDGVNVDWAFAAKAPFAVVVPVIVKALFTVVVPVPAPTEMVVAAPPIFKVVAVELNRVAVTLVVVKSPPLRARSPVDVMLPFLAIVN